MPLPDISPLKPTPVYDTYWRFAVQRQRIFFRRLEGKLPPWTDDPVFRAYKFTNAYRASVRASQYLIRRVIYRDDLPTDPVEVAGVLIGAFHPGELYLADLDAIGGTEPVYDTYRAIRGLEAFTKKHPGDDRAWSALGFAYHAAGRPKDAEAAMRRYIGEGHTAED